MNFSHTHHLSSIITNIVTLCQSCLHTPLQSILKCVNCIFKCHPSDQLCVDCLENEFCIFTILDIIWKCETNIIHNHEIDKILNINLPDEPGSFVLIKSKKNKSLL